MEAQQVQQSLQEGVAGGVDQDFGWRRGKYFAVQLPNITYGWGYGNDTNIPVYTRVFFRYAEQEVELIKDPELIFKIINGMVPSHHVSMPITSSQDAIAQALQTTYGMQGYPVYPPHAYRKAIQVYTEILAPLGGPSPLTSQTGGVRVNR